MNLGLSPLGSIVYKRRTRTRLEIVHMWTLGGRMLTWQGGLLTWQGLKSIGSGCPRLRYLSISCCFKITDSAVVAIAHSCLRLQKIRMDSCRLLSDRCVKALCHSGLRLRYLSMQHCPKLSDESLKHLLVAPSIRLVDLGR